MENFWYNDEIVNDMEDLLEILDHEDGELESLPDDWNLDCEEMEKQNIHKFTIENIVQTIHEERFSENNFDEEYNKICTIISKNIDLESLNNQIPELWYPNGVSFKITKKNLLEYIDNSK